MRPENQNKIKNLDLQDKDWKKELAQILRSEGMEDAYYSLSQNLLKEGQNERDNLFLYYILNVPDNISNKNTNTSFYSTLSKLIDQNLINKTDSYLTQSDFYEEGPEDTLYKLKLMGFIKDKRQLSKFGDPEYLDKKSFFNGNIPKSAAEMKEILHSWQTKNGDEEDEKETSLNGWQIVQRALKLPSKPTKISYIIEYLEQISEPKMAEKAIQSRLSDIKNKYIKQNNFKRVLISCLDNYYKVEEKGSLYSNSINSRSLDQQLNMRLAMDIIEYSKNPEFAGRKNNKAKANNQTITGAQIIQNALGLEEYENIARFEYIINYIKNNVSDSKLLNFFNSREIRANLIELDSSKGLNKWLNSKEYQDNAEGRNKFNKELASYIASY